jgi:DNA-directed DNA polymerase III PolC
MHRFCNTHLHTAFSIKDAIYFPEDYLKKIKESGGTSCAITDHGTMAGVFDFYDAAKEQGIKPILGCLLKGQEIITSTGIKNVEDIEIGDLVLTHKGRFKRVKRLMEKYYNGYVYEITLNNRYFRKLQLTEEHPIYIRKNNGELCWLKPKEIKYDVSNKIGGIEHWNSYVCLPKIKNNNYNNVIIVNNYLPDNLKLSKGIIKKTFKYNKYEELKKRENIDKNIIIDEDMAYFLGLYTAEGSVAHKKKSNILSGQIKISLNRKEMKYQSFVIKFLKKKFNITVKKYNSLKRKNSTELYCCNLPLANVLGKICGVGAKNKKIPFEIFNCSDNIIKAYIKGLLDGDGKKGKINTLKISSKNLAWQFRTLIVNFGTFCGVTEGYEKSKIYDKIYKFYMIHFSYNKNFSHTLQDNDYVYKPIKNITKKIKNVKVYNFEVEEDNSYVSDFILHNCEGYMVEDKLIKNKKTESRDHIILLAKNKKGYEKLLKLQYDSSKYGFYYKPRFDFNDIKELGSDIICSSACAGGIIARHLNDDPFLLEKRILKFKEIFKDDFYFEYVALSRAKYYGPIWQKMFELSLKYGIKSIITTDTHYINKDDWHTQQILHNIANKVTMNEIKQKEKTGEGKGWIMEDKDLYLKSYDEIMDIMRPIFNDNLNAEFLKNTLEIAEKVENYEIYPKNFVFPASSITEEDMKTKIKENLKKKVKLTSENIKIYQDRVKYEWGVIKNMGFVPYFALVTDIIDWAKKNDVPIGGGRGSACGSLISYLLDITEVDSIKYGLSFERFLNPTRTSKAPDIDTDISKNKRQQVLSYIKRYGEENVIQIGSYGTFKTKNTFKDVARIFDISAEEANIITKNMLDDDNKKTVLPTIDEIIDILYPQREEKDKPENKEKIKETKIKYEKILKYTKHLKGMIRQFGTHAGGIVITDKPVYEYFPVINNGGDVISAIDGETLSSKNFLKIDMLGLNSLDIVYDALNYIKKYEHKDIDLEKINLEDNNILSMFREADTENIFQFNTPSMIGGPFITKTGYRGYTKGLLERLQPNKFEDIVILNAINRPAALSINMDKKYEDRRFGMSYTSPKILEKHLKDTLGLMIYQEQVMYILSDLLDISLGKADIMRKKMEKSKIKDLLSEGNYFEYLYKKYDKKDLEDALSLLEEAGGYGFNKCLTGDVILYKKFGGCKKNITIEEQFKIKKSKKYNTKLLSVDINNKIVENELINIYDSGEQEIYKIELENGKKIKATINHKFMTNQGYKTIKEIIEQQLTIEMAYIEREGTRTGSTGFIPWNLGLTKNIDERLNNLSKMRMGNTRFLDKFGGQPHNKGKTKDNYEPLKHISEKMLGGKASEETKLKQSESAKKRDRKGVPGKRSPESCKRMSIATLKLHHDGKFPKTMTSPHRKVIEIMKNNDLWNGFDNEVTEGFHSIDIANKDRKIAIFVDGDYWHGSDFYMKKRNKTEYDFIQKKNRGQDKSANTYLGNRGWTILRLWENEINNKPEDVLNKIRSIIDGENNK